MHSRRTALLSAVALAAAGFMSTLTAPAAAQDKPAAAPPAASAAPAAAAGKYFEMRVYTAAAGKMDALHARFRDHTLRLFKKHGIESVAYWVAVDEKNVGKLVFVIAYPDQASR